MNPRMLLRVSHPIQQPELTPEESDSLIAQLGRPVLSGLSAAGNTLDILGGVVRNALGGENPLAPLGDITGGSGRLSGRDVLTRWGVTPPNNEDWSWEDAPYDVAGLALEIATDPVSWFVPFGKTAQGLRAAKAGTLTKGLGNAIRAGDRALFTFSPPFTSIAKPLGTGEWSARMGDRVSQPIDKLWNSRPGLWAQSLFGGATRGAKTAEVQAGARAATAEKQQLDVASKLMRDKAVQEFDRVGALDPTWESAQLANQIAGADSIQQLDPLYHDAFRAWRNVVDALDPETLRQAGANASTLTPGFPDQLYNPRFAMKGGTRQGGPRAATTINPANIAREPWANDLPQIEMSMNEVARSAALHPKVTQDMLDQWKLLTGMPGFDAMWEYAGRLSPRAIDQPQFYQNMAEQFSNMFQPGTQLQTMMRYLTDPQYKPLAKAAEDLAKKMQIVTSEQAGRAMAGRTGMTPEFAQLVYELRHDPESWYNLVANTARGTKASGGGQALPDLYRVFDNGKVSSVPGRWRAMADSFAGYDLDTLRNRGVYAHPLEALARQQDIYNEVLSNSRSVLDVLRGAPPAPLTGAAMKLGDVFSDLSMNPEAAARNVGDIHPLTMAPRAQSIGDQLVSPKILKEAGGKEFSLDLLQSVLGDPVKMAKLAGSSENLVPLRELIAAERDKILARADALKTPAAKQKWIDKAAAYDQQALEGMLMREAERRGVNDVLNRTISPALHEDLTRLKDTFTVPENVGAVRKFLGNLLNIWKEPQTVPWPQFHAQNALQAGVRNILNGLISPSRALSAYRQAKALLRGGDIGDWADLQIVQDRLKELGLENTPRNATEALRGILSSYGVVGEHINPTRAAYNTSEAIDDITSAYPGGIGGKSPYDLDRLKELAKEGSWWKFWKVRGVDGRRTSEWIPSKIGGDVAQFTESLNRIPAWVERVREGYAPSIAKEMVDSAHVNYGRGNFSPFEREWLQFLFPFYRWSSRQIPHLVNELLNNPGGPVAMAIKLGRHGKDEGTPLPDYIAGTTAIPLGKTADGALRYLTGMGLQEEDPLSLFGNTKEVLQELGSRTSPFVRYPIELMTGVSLNNRGPMGPRPITDVDPLLGRLLANITGDTRPVEVPQWLEGLASNAPTARLMSAGKNITSPRARTPEGAGLTLMQMLGGPRVTTFSKPAADALLRELLQTEIKNLGGSTFTTAYVPKDVLSKMSPEQRQSYLRLQLIQKKIADEAKKRKATAAASGAA